MKVAEILKKKLSELIENEINFDANENLFDKGLTSIQFIQLLAFLEESFSINISDAELIFSNLDTINKLITVINSKMHENL